MRKYFQLVLLSIFFMHDLHAQENVFVFSHLKEKEGLSYNVVNCFLKDSRGIFWIGTQNGLNRFDGSNFYSFKVSRSGNSIPDGEIMSLCEDKKGNIWGGTANGIFCYSPGKNKFITYFPLDSKLGNSFLNILCDKQGNIWAGGWITLLKFIPASNSFREIIRLSGIDSARQFSMRQNCMLEDPSGNGLWMATRTGMFYYDSKKDQLISNVNQPGNPLFTRNNVSALSRSQGGHFWCFDNATKEIIAFDPQLKKILFGINVGKNMPAAVGATLFEDKQNRIWFSSWSSEMIVVDYLKNKEVTQIRHSNDFSSSIAHTFCWAIDQDEDGTIWFGSLSGISRCNPEKSIYTLYGLPEKIDLFKKNRNISLIKEDPSDNSLWILSDDKNLIHYFKEQKRYEVFDLTKARPGADGRVLDAIYAIRFYNEGVILCSNFGNWYKPAAKKQFEPFSLFPPGYPDFASVYYVSSGDTVFYYSNIKNVLYWNRLTGKTKLIGFDIDTLPNGSVPIAGSMVLDTHNKLWVYCSAGWVSELRGDTLHPVLISKNEKGESVGYFNSMEADNAGNIWLSNQLTGLYRYNTKSGQIENWDESDGLSVYGANRALIGNRGQVWMPNGTRVSVLAPDVNTIYDFSLPLEDNTVGYYNSIENLHNGNILLSVYNELVEFKPQQLNIVPAKRKPQISLVNVSGKDYIVNGNSKQIFKADENTMRFQFGILTDKEFFPYDLEYMLEGAENKWTVASGSGKALYNNLAAGTYSFRVRAKGKNNAWQTEETVFNFSIKSPFYKALWFWLVIAALLIATLMFFYRFRLNKQKQILTLETKAQQLEKEKTIVMYENLKQQLNPHFLFNSLTSLSGLIETDQQVAGNFLEQMSGIYRYILKNGDNETVFLKDEIEFAQLYINLQQTRFKNGLQVNINVPEEYMHYKIAPVTLQNLIENAIKHNIIDSSSPLVIDIFIEGDYLVVKNNLQKKNVVETSNKKGLEQFASLYKYLSTLPVIIEETNTKFQIKIPLI